MENRRLDDIVRRRSPVMFPTTATAQTTCRFMRDHRIGAILVADTLKPTAQAVDALGMVQDGGYRRMPIVDGDAIVGIVSSVDFLGVERARLDEETGFREIM